jgi:hypothetical protein
MARRDNRMRRCLSAARYYSGLKKETCDKIDAVLQAPFPVQDNSMSADYMSFRLIHIALIIMDRAYTKPRSQKMCRVPPIECPLWVTSGHEGTVGPMSAFPSKADLRTARALMSTCPESSALRAGACLGK